MTETEQTPTAPTESGAPYQVLARKYRPTTFAGLIGQGAMVRTLTNAINAERLAHAFILTGVRGIGKTSTARIIARALNCIGADGNAEGPGGPTPEPCGTCEHCLAIAEDRHVDVLEMDAASRTGVDDIRELIESVRYRPTSARFKVYIIDEVHMLSKPAFNALLKTLEEPPEHVKFVFATTEIRKVPVTVLSRCQRFDLRRVDADTLARHFKDIAEKEGARISDAAIDLIVRAADGSVRDGLSLLDQAISHTDSGAGGEAEIGADAIRAMLGLADRSRSFMLLEAVLAGDVAPALALLDEMYREGADPLAILEDLLEITHWLTRIKVVPAAADAPQVAEIERVRGKDLEARLAMADLARAWQMLLKGLGEARQAPSSIQAVEMALVRLAYAARLPTPEEAIRGLGADAPAAKATAPAPAGERSPPPPQPEPKARMTGTGDARAASPEAALEPAPEAAHEPAHDPAPEPAPEPAVAPSAEAGAEPGSMEDIQRLALEHGETVLHGFLAAGIRPLRFEAGLIEFPSDSAPGEMVHALSEFLNRVTARTWTLTVTRGDDAATVADGADGQATDERAAREHPLVKAVLKTFPGATIDEVQAPAPGGPDVEHEDGA